MRLLFGAALATVCTVTGVAGCAATHQTTVVVTPAATRSPGVSPSPGPSVPATTPRQRAVADAASILASFVAPPGARRLAHAPGVEGGALASAPTAPLSDTLVDDVSWWEAPGQPQAVLAWVKARLPSRFALEATGYENQGGVRWSWNDTFSLPAVPGVLNVRDLVVEVAGAGGGQTAIRVDAEVTWQPPRPASEQVPSAARVVTITQLRSGLPGSKRPPAPVTITGQVTVRRLASLVDGLPVSTLQSLGCPALFGGGIQLTFRARPDGPALAVADTAGACNTVLFSIGSTPEPLLANSGWLVSQVLKVAGLHWRVN